MKEVKLPSGATLRITPSTFAEAKALYQAVLRELKLVQVSQGTVGNLYKDLFCVGFSSPEIEACLWACFQRCTYDAGKGALRIDADTFEPVERRDDYMKVCMEVAKENIGPFGKSLYAEYKHYMSMAESAQA